MIRLVLGEIRHVQQTTIVFMSVMAKSTLQCVCLSLSLLLVISRDDEVNGWMS